MGDPWVKMGPLGTQSPWALGPMGTRSLGTRSLGTRALGHSGAGHSVTTPKDSIFTKLYKQGGLCLSSGTHTGTISSRFVSASVHYAAIVLHPLYREGKL